MTLVDPSRRWWNRDGARRFAAWVCWIVAIVGTFLGVVQPTFAVGSEPPVLSLVALTAAVPLLILGSFLHREHEDENRRRGWVFGHVMAMYFVALGGGLLLGELRGGALVLEPGTDSRGVAVTGAVMLLAGLVAMVVIEVIGWRVLRARRMRDRVEREGIETSGRVSRVGGFSINYRDVSRTTVKFTDRYGATRWATQVLPGHVTKDEIVRVKYLLPERGKRAHTSISRR